VNYSGEKETGYKTVLKTKVNLNSDSMWSKPVNSDCPMHGEVKFSANGTTEYVLESAALEVSKLVITM